jgi:type IV secretion system protein VirD4
VRITFATNDERTAKRISDSLGTATEMRAQRNYAGHRLAPWLGHLMVSRQETARPLLTPGEVMQLPPDEEVVMISGHPPIKAAKLRYYLDRNFTGRVLAPPVLAVGAYADRPAARPDDWSGLAVPAVSAMSALGDVGGFADEGGHQLKPELDVALDAPVLPQADDLLVLDDDDDAPLRPQRWVSQKPELDPIDRRLDRTARLAALDPDDGIAL